MGPGKGLINKARVDGAGERFGLRVSFAGGFLALKGLVFEIAADGKCAMVAVLSR